MDDFVVPHSPPQVMDTKGEAGKGEIGINASVFFDWVKVMLSGGSLNHVSLWMAPLSLSFHYIFKNLHFLLSFLLFLLKYIFYLVVLSC